MSLRKKAILMICVGFAAALVMTFGISQTILMKRFAALERENTTQNTQRVVSALYKDFSSIDITFNQQAFDSGAFAWVQDGQDIHLEINMDGPSFVVMNTNFIAFVTASGQPLMGMGYDLQTVEPIPLPVGFLEELRRSENPLSAPPQGDSTCVTGILVLPETALLVQSFPVDVDTIYGHIQGRTVFARFLDDTEVGRLSEQTHLSLALYRWNDSEMPTDFMEAKDGLSDEAPVVTQTLSGDTVAGYGLLGDVYGNPAMIMRADMPRDIYHQGQQTVYWLIALLTAVFAVFALAVIILMNRVILSRLLGLSKGVDSVRETGDLTERVAVQGKDEVSRLGEAVNGMLASLEMSQRQLAEREAEKQALLNAIPDLMFRVSRDGTILDARAVDEDNLTRTQVRSTDGKPYQESLQYKVLSAEVVCQGLPLVKQALQTRETQTFEIQVPLNGDTAFYEARVAASLENEALVMVRDVTERKRAERRLEYASNHDALSGLYNRAYFEGEFARIVRDGGPFPLSVVMVDVDGMKAVNDNQGHDAGDALLRRTASVLAATFRARDVVSRIGGDEFAVLLPGADSSGAEKALARVRDNLFVHNSKYRGTNLSLSVGVATGEEGCQLADLMREADDRMYQEKQAKKAAAKGASGQLVR
ncbi:MAG: diguanylate cyclase [Dehalococcoidia bacterium]|nr:diguanylate cyclase [Dehalococcoidia bacterium]